MGVNELFVNCLDYLRYDLKIISECVKLKTCR